MRLNGMEKIYLEKIEILKCRVLLYVIYWLKLIDISCLPNDPT